MKKHVKKGFGAILWSYQPFWHNEDGSYDVTDYQLYKLKKAGITYVVLEEQV